jgi:uncharacterized protein YkwD
MATGAMPFSHLGFNERCAQIPFAYRSTAENLAWNEGVSDTAKVAVDGWIRSDGHRKNLLSATNVCGVGVARSNTGQFYYTQLFARDYGSMTGT